MGSKNRIRHLGRTLLLMIPGLAAASEGVGQMPIGVPFVGDHHVSAWSTGPVVEGIGEAAAGTSSLYGGRYGHRFGVAEDPTRFSVLAGVAGRRGGPDGGALDLAVTAAWTRRWVGTYSGLFTTAAVGVGAFFAGGSDADPGRRQVRVPFTAGAGYDLRVGDAVLSPFVAPRVARYSVRSHLGDGRVSTLEGWEAQLAAGASLRLAEVVLTSSRVRDLHPSPGWRWALAAGVSF